MHIFRVAALMVFCANSFLMGAYRSPNIVMVIESDKVYEYNFTTIGNLRNIYARDFNCPQECVRIMGHGRCFGLDTNNTTYEQLVEQEGSESAPLVPVLSIIVKESDMDVWRKRVLAARELRLLRDNAKRRCCCEVQ